jgi:hypothetical protein
VTRLPYSGQRHRECGVVGFHQVRQAYLRGQIGVGGGVLHQWQDLECPRGADIAYGLYLKVSHDLRRAFDTLVVVVLLQRHCRNDQHQQRQTNAGKNLQHNAGLPLFLFSALLYSVAVMGTTAPYTASTNSSHHWSTSDLCSHLEYYGHVTLPSVECGLYVEQGIPYA